MRSSAVFEAAIHPALHPARGAAAAAPAADAQSQCLPAPMRTAKGGKLPCFSGRGRHLICKALCKKMHIAQVAPAANESRSGEETQISANPVAQKRSTGKLSRALHLYQARPPVPRPHWQQQRRMKPPDQSTGIAQCPSAGCPQLRSEGPCRTPFWLERGLPPSWVCACKLLTTKSVQSDKSAICTVCLASDAHTEVRLLCGDGRDGTHAARQQSRPPPPVITVRLYVGARFGTCIPCPP
eukprot:1084369-Prymnesium_polylepis.1